jgi:hypothetical protein
MVPAIQIGKLAVILSVITRLKILNCGHGNAAC